jgi:hypothetical protein
MLTGIIDGVRYPGRRHVSVSGWLVAGIDPICDAVLLKICESWLCRVAAQGLRRVSCAEWRRGSFPDSGQNADRQAGREDRGAEHPTHRQASLPIHRWRRSSTQIGPLGNGIAVH